MINILITGADSYIGTSVENWLSLSKFNGYYNVKTLDMHGDGWKTARFSKYDVIFHVAGIAHIKETAENAELYYKVNRDLAIETAEKAKQEGVKQFILLSSMSVYGILEGVIDNCTAPHPISNYGTSKLQADIKILNMNSSTFATVILRPPMVYGKGCKGNYQTLRKIAIHSPFFPDIKNQRSMIYIDNLAEFIRYVIDNKKQGIFHPQNRNYVCTSEMVLHIARAHNKSIRMIRLPNMIFKKAAIPSFKKAFGNLIYTDNIDTQYEMVSFEASIKKTEC